MQLGSLEQKLIKGGIPFERVPPKALNVAVRGKIPDKEYTITFSESEGRIHGMVIFKETEALYVGDVLLFCDEVTDFIGDVSLEIDQDGDFFYASFMPEGARSLKKQFSELADLCERISHLLHMAGTSQQWNGDLISFALTQPQYLPQA